MLEGEGLEIVVAPGVDEVSELIESVKDIIVQPIVEDVRSQRELEDELSEMIPLPMLDVA